LRIVVPRILVRLLHVYADAGDLHYAIYDKGSEACAILLGVTQKTQVNQKGD
jgi:hypothetical protein